MNKIRNNKGFTLAEMMLVVAIVVILAAVVFIAVNVHQRSLERLELDGIAKEIFVAAQNHLSLADSQGLLSQRAENGAEYDGSYKSTRYPNSEDVRYFVVPASSVTDNRSVLNLMLPMAAVDETVRLGGSYIILYDYATATVLDVFYAEQSGGRFAHKFETTESIDNLLTNFADDIHVNDRKNYTNGSVIGWYGGAEANSLPKAELKEPSFTIHNGDTLYVSVTNPNDTGKAKLALIVRGRNADGDTIEYSFPLGDATGTSKFVLDDITSSTEHFHKLCPNIKPGEDIEITLTAEPKDTLARPIVVGPQTTNSLFAAVSGGVAEISSFRHLENLEQDVSGFTASTAVASAKQISDLDWNDFFASDSDKPAGNKILNASGATLNLEDKHYYPVDLNSFDYDGQRHTISNVTTVYPNNVGLFCTVTDSTVSDLELVDFSIESQPNSTPHSAGALAGTTSGSKITNVLVRSTGTTAGVTSAGCAGGLIGTATNSTIEKCGAVLPVESNGANAAGGLIGKATGTTSFTYCYSGGHTSNGAYDPGTTGYDVLSKKVEGSTTTYGVAGGLVGDANGATIVNSYSTCSASGSTVGGLAGEASGRLTNSYATGLVSGTTAGALVGNYAGTVSAVTNCHYYRIINENVDGSGLSASISYLAPFCYVNNGETQTAFGGLTPEAAATWLAKAKALDGTTEEYNKFYGNPTNWTAADPTDSVLGLYYQGKFPLKTVGQLKTSDQTLDDVNPLTDFVARHYGDWPAPELRVVNVK